MGNRARYWVESVTNSNLTDRGTAGVWYWGCVNSMTLSSRLIEARIWASVGVGGEWCWMGYVVASELTCALGEMSDTGDWDDIRLGGAIPSEMTTLRE